MRRSPWTRWSAAAALCFTACDLEEVTIPIGEPVLVVHAVMRPDLAPRFAGSQFIVVERTFAGDVGNRIHPITRDTIRLVNDTLTIPYGGRPPLPVTQAIVEVVNLDYPNDPCGSRVAFTEEATSGVYWSPAMCPSMRPGDRLALRIQTADGAVVTGETRIPGMDSATYAIGPITGVFDRSQPPTINRDQDTLRVVAHAQSGRLLQLEVRRLGDLSDFGTKILADTTALTVPGDLINTFVLGDEDDVFRAGRDYVVTAAVTDTNYFDFVRSSNNKYTGRGFINRLTGGIGVFGSMVAVSMELRAVGDVDDPREGRYRMQGVLQDTLPVDLEWDLYLARPADTTEHSAFVEGRWLYGDVVTSSDGDFDDDAFTMVIIDTLGFVRRDTIFGFWVKNQPWTVTVATACRDPSATPEPGTSDPCDLGRRHLGTLTVTKQ